MVVVAAGDSDREEARLGGGVVWVKGPTLPAKTRYRVLYRTRAVHEILECEAPDLVEASSPYAAAWAVSRWNGRASKVFVYHEDTAAVMSHVLLGPGFGSMAGDQSFDWPWSYLRGFTSRFDATVVSGSWPAGRPGHFGMRRPEPVLFGIDKSLLSPSRRNSGLRSRIPAECGAPVDGRLLVTVSRLHPEKRLQAILKGFQLASTRHLLGLTIGGDGWQRLGRAPRLEAAGCQGSRVYQ